MDASDRLALSDLQHRYGDVVSRRAWSELEDLLHPGCRLELALRDKDLTVDGSAEVIEFVSRSVSSFDRFLFSVLNHVVGPGPTGRMWIQELRWSGDDHSTAYGLYDDAFVRDDEGRWRFASRRYTSISGGRYQP